MFTVGDGLALPGVDAGVRGMRRGGVRRLVLPIKQAYVCKHAATQPQSLRKVSPRAVASHSWNPNLRSRSLCTCYLLSICLLKACLCLPVARRLCPLKRALDPFPLALVHGDKLSASCSARIPTTTFIWKWRPRACCDSAFVSRSLHSCRRFKVQNHKSLAKRGTRHAALSFQCFGTAW